MGIILPEKTIFNFSTSSCIHNNYQPSVSSTNNSTKKKSQNIKNMVNCLLLVTGSVAAIKLFKLEAELLKQLPQNSQVQVIITESASHFIKPELVQIPEPDDHENSGKEMNNDDNNNTNTFEHWMKRVKIHRDADEWSSYNHRGDPVLHIQLRKWADIAVIAPLDANTLAKISHGLADNLLSCVMRAWEWKKKPVVLAPAMNTAMWEHPLTEPQLEIIKKFGGNNNQVVVVDPVGKKLECNDVGVGALAPVEEIAKVVAELVSASSSSVAKE